STATVDDDWLITDDSSPGATGGDPVVTHVVAGAGGRQRPASFVKAPNTVDYSYSLSLAPGETKIVMHFASQAANQATALARAPQLAALELDALKGMSALERSQVVNFNVGDTVDAYSFIVNAGDHLVLQTATPGD